MWRAREMWEQREKKVRGAKKNKRKLKKNRRKDGAGKGGKPQGATGTSSSVAWSLSSRGPLFFLAKRRPFTRAIYPRAALSRTARKQKKKQKKLSREEGEKIGSKCGSSSSISPSQLLLLQPNSQPLEKNIKGTKLKKKEIDQIYKMKKNWRRPNANHTFALPAACFFAD